MNNNATVPPGYKQILEAMGQQLKTRKLALFKRTFLITWPYILLFILIYLFNELYDFNSLAFDIQLLLGALGLFLLICSSVYSIIIKFIFEIEKQIWVDSYFDQKNLDLSESWRIAKKLFWPAFKFRLNITFRYYLIPITIWVVFIGLLFYFRSFAFNGPNSWVFSVALFLLFFVGLYAYCYYLRVKLRYSWFLFLDNFGSNYSYELTIEEMNKLNGVSKSDTFKKSLIANLGTDSVKDLAQFTINTMTLGVSSFGNMGKLIGSVANVYAGEANRQATNFGNIAAQYVLYRFARKELYGEEQLINNSLYEI